MFDLKIKRGKDIAAFSISESANLEVLERFYSVLAAVHGKILNCDIVGVDIGLTYHKTMEDLDGVVTRVKDLSGRIESAKSVIMEKLVPLEEMLGN